MKGSLTLTSAPSILCRSVPSVPLENSRCERNSRRKPAYSYSVFFCARAICRCRFRMPALLGSWAHVFVISALWWFFLWAMRCDRLLGKCSSSVFQILIINGRGDPLTRYSQGSWARGSQIIRIHWPSGREGCHTWEHSMSGLVIDLHCRRTFTTLRMKIFEHINRPVNVDRRTV